MSNPGKAAAPDHDEDDELEGHDAGSGGEGGGDDEGDGDETYEAKINQLATNVTRDEKTGRYVLPDGLSEEQKVAVVAERRRRDTQSMYTRTTQENKRLKAEKAALLDIAGDVKVELTKEQTEELEELKFSDPDAWRKKMNRYEQEAVTKHQQGVQERLKHVSTDKLDKEEIEERKQTLADFNRRHPDFKLDDDVIANDIPPRIVRRLAEGQVDFETFLQECYDYSKTGKVVKQDKVRRQPNLSRVGGGAKPDSNAVTEDAVLSYQKEVF